MRVIQRVAARTDRIGLGRPSAILAALGLALSATPVAVGQTADKAMTVHVTASERLGGPGPAGPSNTEGSPITIPDAATSTRAPAYANLAERMAISGTIVSPRASWRT